MTDALYHDDWRLEAASEIMLRVTAKTVTTDFTVADIIEKHCPFKPEGVYVTMDEHQAALAELNKLREPCPVCCRVGWHGAECSLAPAEYREYAKPLLAEPPLLQCVDCRNTESCAGAMARLFNRGRCMYCGGAFAVVRG